MKIRAPALAILWLMATGLTASAALADGSVQVNRTLVDSFKECREPSSDPKVDFRTLPKLKTDISRDEMQKLFERRLFPGPADAMGEFISRTERTMELNRNRAFACPRNPYADAKMPSDIETSLASIVRETQSLLKLDVEAQRALLENGEVCSRKIAELTKSTGKKMSELKISDFNSLKGKVPDDEECAGFNEVFVPALSAKLREMRILMVVGEDPTEDFGPRGGSWGDRVRHDKPFSQDLAANFFPSVWKSGSKTRLRGLSADEFRDAAKLAKEIPHQVAQDRYYQILSNSPILLFFDDQVTPDGLVTAYSQMKKQSSNDLEKMIDSAPQEIMLMIPYVQKALANIPLKDRGNACAVVGQIFENLNKRYEQVPQAIAQVGLVLSLVGGLGGKTVKEGVAIAVKQMGWTSMLYGGVMAKDTFSKYSRGVAMCSVQVVESSLCDFNDVDRLYRKGQSHVVGSAISGTLMFGIGRALRPAVP